MKKRLGRLILLAAIIAVFAVTVTVGTIYLRFISQGIYRDSTDHLVEIYGQVNRSFGSFLERNWGMLESWGTLFSESDGLTSESIEAFASKERQYWGFSELYFIDGEHNCMTASGEKCVMSLDDGWDILESGSPIMVGQKISGGEEITLFASPVAEGNYMGLNYCALAVSYTNADLSSALKVDAFSGKAKCFVIQGDGRVLLSTQNGGNVFENYYTYLKAASNMDPNELEQMRSEWQEGKSGVRTCDIANVRHCILYQPVGYQNYIMLSVVPESAVRAGFLSVQKTTVKMFVVIFLIIGAAAVILAVTRSRSLLLKNRTELQYREKMFDVLSSSVDDIFIMLDTENERVDYVSPNIDRLLGVKTEAARKNIKELERCAVNYNVVIPQDELNAIPMNQKKIWECEYMHLSTGERRWYRVTIYHMEIQGVKKHIIVMSDRTLEQQMNQKLQEALNAAQSANEAKSNFLSNMSHDIRTPMNAIVGFSILLEKDADQPDKVKEYTKKITASSHHLLSLINDVLDMSKIESGKTSLNVDKFSLPELLEDLSIIISPQAKAKKQEFRILVQGALPEQMIGDKLRLNQILINLLSNAVKYTPDGGKIDFLISDVKDVAPPYIKLRFVVRDNGIGMSEEFLTRIFHPFSREINSVTNKIQGTGLGMAITKNLVDLMGGIISVESHPGTGSIFTVELSFTLAENEETEAWYRQKISRILVADDEEEICLDIKELMDGTGVNVEYATSGAEAVKKAIMAHCRENDFDVILLDWKMPGMDGVETARNLRNEIGKSVPILVLTSYDWADIEDEARQAGINAFMPKPFFVSTFWQTIKPLFDRKHEVEPKNENLGETMKGLKFLIAEDNELNAEIITEMLTIEGAEFEVTSNGLEAYEKFKASEPGRFDMILMDVQMPVMNGYEATRKIRACDRPDAKTIPIAAMTANTFAEDVKNSLEAGMDGHLAKPIDMDAVRALVNRLLSREEGEAKS